MVLIPVINMVRLGSKPINNGARTVAPNIAYTCYKPNAIFCPAGKYSWIATGVCSSHLDKTSSLQTSFLLNSRPLDCLNGYSNFDCRFASSYSFSILRHCSEICALPRDTLIKGFLALRFFVIMLGITLFLDIYYDRPHTYSSLSNRLSTRRYSLYRAV